MCRLLRFFPQQPWQTMCSCTSFCASGHCWSKFVLCSSKRKFAIPQYSKTSYLMQDFNFVATVEESPYMGVMVKCTKKFKTRFKMLV